jgi:hypothetical protein
MDRPGKRPPGKPPLRPEQRLVKVVWGLPPADIAYVRAYLEAHPELGYEAEAIRAILREHSGHRIAQRVDSAALDPPGETVKVCWSISPAMRDYIEDRMRRDGAVSITRAVRAILAEHRAITGNKF